MNVRVHLPETEEGMEKLLDRLAKFKADWIINEINKLPYSYEIKLEVLEEIKKRLKEGGEVWNFTFGFCFGQAGYGGYRFLGP